MTALSGALDRLSRELPGGGVSCLLCDHGVARAADPVWTVALGGAFAGPARTVSVPDGDLQAVRAAVAALRPGEVLVVAAGGSSAALWGDRLTAAAQARGAAGVIVDGYVRDVQAVAASGLGLRARGTLPRRAEPTGQGALDVPVEVAGVRLAPGDGVLADADGVVAIAAQDAGTIERQLEAWLRAERAAGQEGTEA